MAGAVAGEEWRVSPSHQGYEVSSLGRVRSWKRQGGRTQRAAPKLRALKTFRGYAAVTLCAPGGVRVTRYVHALVLEAFVGPRPPGHEACHLDGNRTHNAIANLAWGTRAENAAHKVLHGTVLRGERQAAAKLSWDSADFIRRNENATSGELAEHFGVSDAAVLSVRRGRTWRAEYAPVMVLTDAEQARRRDWVPEVRRAAGRSQRGERHPQARLTREGVSAIRASAEPHGTLAARYGVSRSTISAIKRGVLWGAP